MKTESATELRRLFHAMTGVVGSLEGVDRPISSSEDLFVFITVERLDPRSRQEWETEIGDSAEPPSYSTLKKFLEKRLHTLEAIQPEKSLANSATDRAGKSLRSHHAQKAAAKTERDRCSLCHKDHFIMICEAFRRKPAEERRTFVETNGLCRNCLGRHKMSDCLSKRSCTVCNERHHSVLHEAFCVMGKAESSAAEIGKSSHVACRPGGGRSAVLLATARVLVRDQFDGEHRVRALVDQGSETSIVSESLVQRLSLPRFGASVAVFGVGGNRAAFTRGRVALRVKSANGGAEIDVCAVILPKLTTYAGLGTSSVREWRHIQGLPLADPDYLESDRVNLLLGADVFASILGPGVRIGAPHDPIAQETMFGWIVSGSVGLSDGLSVPVSLQCSVDETLTALVCGFWEQEEVAVCGPAESPADQECEAYFSRNHWRDGSGRYTVRMPTKEPLPDLERTRALAQRSLVSMERRFERNAELRSKYVAFMREYESLGHMTRVDDAEVCRRRCYLPYHGVLKGEGPSAKLRVVFNGSAPLPGGDTLNRFLHAGSNLVPALADVILGWRRYRLAYTADIEKMYRQVIVAEEDRDLQRILRRESADAPVVEFRLNTVTYGLTCGNSVEEARSSLLELRRLCTAGGFPLKKWAASAPELLQDIPPSDLSRPGVQTWGPQEFHAALGLQWHPDSDAFSFRVRAQLERKTTKRSVVSQAAQLFDPAGWLSPAVVRAKIFIQKLWLLNLPALETVRVPRWIGVTDRADVEIHGFADASEAAYAAVVYSRSKGSNGNGWTTSLVASKTRVAPLKQVSLPRLELCGAVLLARLASRICRLLDIQGRAVHLWSDSTVALGWLRQHPSRWSTFVANRVSEVQTTLPNAQWHHVRGKENPADCASRGLAPSDLVAYSLWWQGPPWLRNDDAFPEDRTLLEESDDLPEGRARFHVVVVRDSVQEPELLLRFSSLARLLRVSAWCRRWTGLDRKRPASRQGALELSAEELHQSMLTWMRVIQASHWSSEIRAVSTGTPFQKGHPLANLSPFLDAQGILRVGGRIRHSLLSFDEKHPMILPRNSHLTGLIIASCHFRVLHGGVQQTLGLLRRQYWIPGGRAAVKRHVHKCSQCVRWRAAAPHQIMADLPSARVTPSRTFQHTGVDYAGPIFIRSSKGRGHKSSKAFISVFICLSTRAVHLDVASDYSSEAFLAAFRRFTARRGLPQIMYSDCGTNFTGADAELQKLFRASSRESAKIHHALAGKGVEWRFNPPAAPHFGGLWEAAVKSVKHHLRRVLGTATLTYEEMHTLLAEIEACLNSRPLGPLSDDPEDVAALTPGHFLVGSALLSVPEPPLLEVPSGRLTRWRRVQQMRDHFWQRWSREFLLGLSSRPKWTTAVSPPRVGQLCLLRNENTPPGRWPLARIADVHPGSDGNVRVVTVRTATSVLVRPLVKIVLMPMENEAAMDNPASA
ncbi:uncharacterized protein [Cardiocondyla obscurior]|uniref:uncharacterized protein n=1 Tax=Cardiocondyla obscurior TaxID=286306 RepID=UPI0039656981